MTNNLDSKGLHADDETKKQEDETSDKFLSEENEMSNNADKEVNIPSLDEVGNESEEPKPQPDIIKKDGVEEPSADNLDTETSRVNQPEETLPSSEDEISSVVVASSSIEKAVKVASSQQPSNDTFLHNYGDDEEDEDVEEEDHEEDDDDSEKVDFTIFTKEELIKSFEHVLETREVQKIRSTIDVIKINFYKKHRADIDELRKLFIENGGAPEEFQANEDPFEVKFKSLLKDYRDKKAEHNRQFEMVKMENLKKKMAVLEEIKELITSKENLNKTFQEFKDLQKKWFNIGVVPQQNLKDLWESYNHNVEMFYDFLKINQELRDLDFKKNLELKINLCEKAEELLLEPSVVKAFKHLQKYHQQWREVGPVPLETREEIWERFKIATGKINKAHQDFFQNLKDTQEENLIKKNDLCVKAEELSNIVLSTPKDWEEKSKELIGLQQQWKNIGFAPKKENNKIYERFRQANDNFFKQKRDFYAQHKDEMNTSLQLKTELCMQAEALQESSDWKKTTDELIMLQKKWKSIGAVNRKNSDKIWKRFRAACDHFFNRKSEHFSTIDSKYDDNLKKKQELVERIEQFQLTENVSENLQHLNSFQREWAEIGFVPLKSKDEIQQRYRTAVNKHFDKLNVDESKRKLMKFQTKVSNLSGAGKNNYRLNQDREKFIVKLKQLESDITLWENNIGFFAKSKSADAMISNVKHKIEDARAEIKMIEEKIQIIDKMDDAVE